MAQSQPLSIYIPRVFGNLDEEYIKSVFEKLDLGRVRRVDLVPRQNPVDEFGGASSTENSNMAFVHFWEWHDNTSSLNFREKVLDSEREARIVYDDPWYWIVLENRNPKSDAQLVTEQKLADAEKKIDELERRLQTLEYEIYGDNIPEGFEVVTDEEGNEYIVEINNPMDEMPQRQNGDGGAEADFRIPQRESSLELPDYYNEALNDADSLIDENYSDSETGNVEIPEWLNNSTTDTLSWQELHEEAERFRREFAINDGGDDEFISKHPTECPSISLPLEEGQIERDTVTGEYYCYSNVNGEHIWTPINV